MISLSTSKGADEPENQGMELEYVSTVTKGLETSDSRVKLTGQDLKIKKEMVEEDLHPGDAEYYSSLQYVYQTLKKSRKNSRNIEKDKEINGIYGMRSAYFQRTGKVLPEGFDTERGKRNENDDRRRP